MTGALDTKMRALSKRLIDKFGTDVTLRRTTSTYDPSTGNPTESTTDHSVNPTESTTDHSVNGVVEPYQERNIDQSLVQIGDMRLTVPAKGLSVTPDTATDTVILDSETWQIVRVDQVWSGNQVAVHQLQLRK